MPESHRVYSEQEASEIVKRASEIAEAKSANTYRSGITRDELTRIAGEMGVPPEALAQAIDEQGAPRQTRPRWGSKAKLESVLDFQADEDALSTVLDTITPMRRHQMVLAKGRLEVSTMSGLMPVRVSVTSRNGRTRLSLAGMPWVIFLMTSYPLLVFGFVFAAQLGKLSGVAGAILAVVLVAVAGALFFAAVQHSIRKMHDLHDSIRESLEAEAKASTELRSRLANAPNTEPVNANAEQRLS